MRPVTTSPQEPVGRAPDTPARVAELLRQETVGGVLLVAAAVLALAWANSPWSDAYASVCDAVVGPAALHLHLPLSAWASDGLLAIFFFVAGLELKREFVEGDLRDPRRAILPVAAAVGGVVTPALIYVAINLAAKHGNTGGWAIPAATDIAFALAVLAVIGRGLPDAFRTFLLTLAVVDDLLAITVIAIFYTDHLDLGLLLLALLPIAAFGLLIRVGAGRWWLLVPLALAAWTLVHASGVHATVAGVLLAFTVPVAARGGTPAGDAGPAERLEHELRPLSAGVAVPVFALLSAGVAIGGWSGLRSALGDPVALGVIGGLIVGKAIGISGATALVTRFTGARLDPRLGRRDVLGLALLGGIGFTVSLLIGELAYGPGSPHDDHVKLAVLCASVLATLLAAAVLRGRRPEPGDSA